MEEAKFFLHNEEEMEKNDFLSTGWPLIKPFLLKAQHLDTHSDTEKVGDGTTAEQQEESTPEVKHIKVCLTS